MKASIALTAAQSALPTVRPPTAKCRSTRTRADTKDTINQWLDGEVSEAVARRADERQVEFWSAVNAQADQRRRMTTPAYMTDAIMAALPDKKVERATMTTAHGDARLSLTPVSAAVAAAGFTALGVLIGRVIGR